MSTENAPVTTPNSESRPVMVAEKPLPRTIYDASGFEVFGKHFLAGFSQALGMILVYVLFLVIAYMLVIRYLLPPVQPYLDMYRQSMQSLQTIQSTFAPAPAMGTGEGEGASEGVAPGVQQTPQGTTTMTVTPEQLQQAQQLLQQMQQKSN